jgi:primase-polymerase (primpol)-like protein
MDEKKRRIRQVFVVAGGIGLLFAVGCGSSMEMTAQTSGEKIFQADKAFAVANDGNASKNAPDDLAVAQRKLAAAKDAFAKQNYDEAARLAEQAVVDADYALARAKTRQNMDIAEGIKKETNSLRQEIERTTK